jgi:hypothetical protein
MAAGVLGLFKDYREFTKATHKLKKSGFSGISLMSPIPLEGVEEFLGDKKSVIKRFTFFGAIIGGLSGFALAAGTAIYYILPTGGRPIITYPPYLIIAYELTILLGILSTLLGFFISARLPALRDRTYTYETNVDNFGVLVTCSAQDNPELAEQIMREAGADEVKSIEEVTP